MKDDYDTLKEKLKVLRTIAALSPECAVIADELARKYNIPFSSAEALKPPTTH